MDDLVQGISENRLSDLEQERFFLVYEAFPHTMIFDDDVHFDRWLLPLHSTASLFSEKPQEKQSDIILRSTVDSMKQILSRLQNEDENAYNALCKQLRDILSVLEDMFVSYDVIRTQLIVLYAIALLNFHCSEYDQSAEALTLIFRKILLFQKLKAKFLQTYGHTSKSIASEKKVDNNPNTSSDNILPIVLEFFSTYCTIEMFDDSLYWRILWLLLFTWMKQNRWDVLETFVSQFKQSSRFPLPVPQASSTNELNSLRNDSEKYLYYWWYIEAVVAYRREMMDSALDSLRQCVTAAPYFLPARFLQGLIYFRQEKFSLAKEILIQVENSRGYRLYDCLNMLGIILAQEKSSNKQF